MSLPVILSTKDKLTGKLGQTFQQHGIKDERNLSIDVLHANNQEIPDFPELTILGKKKKIKANTHFIMVPAAKQRTITKLILLKKGFEDIDNMFL